MEKFFWMGKTNRPTNKNQAGYTHQCKSWGLGSGSDVWGQGQWGVLYSQQHLSHAIGQQASANAPFSYWIACIRLNRMLY